MLVSPALQSMHTTCNSGTGSKNEGGILVASTFPSNGTASTSSSLLNAALPVSPSLISGYAAQSQSDAASSSSSTLPRSMLIEDTIHGSYTITEPVLIELLLSKPVQRLKHVLQHGITALIGMVPSPTITRYEHSVGAMLLVRAAGGTIEAQASALLHDIAHTALSHVVDGVFGYVVHEEDKMEYLNTTSIPAILRMHGLVAEDVLDERNYPLLELDAPAVSSDRLDYGIRDSLSFGFLTLTEARSISRDLTPSRNGRFCFKSIQWAKKLSEAYMQSDEYAWSNPKHSLLYDYAADTIRLAHATDEMEKSELWEDEGDDAFWRKMTESSSEDVRRLASRVTKRTQVEEIAASEYDETRRDQYMEATTKVRTIDPDVQQPDGSVMRLTLLSEEYRLAREAYLEHKSGSHYYRVIEGEADDTINE